MTNHNDALLKTAVALLRIDADQWAAIKDTRRRGTYFSTIFPHDITAHVRPGSLAIIDVPGDTPQLHIGVLRSRRAVATLETRVTFDLVQPIKPDSLDILLNTIDPPTLKASATKLRRSEATLLAVSPKLAVGLLQTIIADPNNNAALKRITAHLGRAKNFGTVRSLQEDAISTALKCFGVIDGAAKVSLPGLDTGIYGLRLQEDAVIEHDARWLPGWSLIDSQPTGHALFRKGDDQLDVYTANRRLAHKNCSNRTSTFSLAQSRDFEAFHTVR